MPSPDRHSPHPHTPLPAGEGRVRGDLSPTLHLTPADLPPRVRRYADNLRAQVLDILRAHNVRTLEDLEWQVRTKKAKGEITSLQAITLLQPIKDILAKLNEIRKTGKLPESERDFIVEHKEHTLDLREILQSSRDFYSSHNLQTLADALPDTPDTLTDAQRERILFALEQGFTSALILPDVSTQTEHLDNILKQTANTPSDKLNGNDQYKVAPYVNKEVKSAPVHNRPSSSLRPGSGQAYLLLYSSGPIPEQTRNKTPENLIQTFTTNHWNGLTLPEYLLLQRIEAERQGNHSFDAYSDTPKDSNWTWLLDSRTSSAVAHADWNPRYRRVKVYWFDLRLADPLLGARPSVVVEL